MEAFINQQKTAILQLKDYINNFNKAGKDRKANTLYLTNRLTELTNWWNAFESCNEQLLEYDGESQPYFSEKSFENTKTVYLDHREKVYTAYQKLKPSPASMTFEESSDEEEDVTTPSNGKKTVMDELPIVEQNDEVVNNPGFVSLKNKLTDLYEVYEMVDNLKEEATTGYISAQLDILKNVWEDFRIKFNKERESENDQISNINFKTAQAKYVIYYGLLNDMKAKRTSKSEGGRLAKIKLREFYGKFDEWPMFISMFDELVHSDTSLSNATKITQLKSYLRGEAAKIVSHIIPAGDNYKICYELLRNRYDNKRAMLSQLLDTMFLIPKQNKEFSRDLKSLYDTINECVLSISALGVKVRNWDPLLNHIILHKLSSETIKNYECQLENVKEPQSYAEFMKYLESRFLALQSAEAKSGNFIEKNNSGNMQNKTNNAQGKSYNYVEKNCIKCNSKHSTMECPDLLKLPVDERLNWVKEKKLCTNCLSNSHTIHNCSSKYNCKTCKKRHNSILHFERKTNVQTAAHMSMTGEVLLATALLCAYNKKNNEQILLRALLDQGSQSNFITEHACQLLGLQKKRADITVFGISAEPKVVKSIVSVEIFSRQFSFSIAIDAIVLPKVTSLHHNTDDLKSFPYLQNLVLADPSSKETNGIDILLGAAEYAKILKPGLIKGSENEPIAQNTEFGWIVSGQSNTNSVRNAVVHVSTLDEQLNKIFETDDTIEESSETDEQKMCEEHFLETHTRDENGKYMVLMPFKNGLTEPSLGDSKKKAIATFFQLENRFKKNDLLRNEYTKFINEYHEMNHMELANDIGSGFYLPHHSVIKESTTTKLRVVFNASQSTSNGMSLNDQLAIGKTSQRDIVAILIAWRFKRFACTSDIEKMYRQIWIHPNQRMFQKILWRSKSNTPIKEFQLSTVTYGMANAPYLAIRTLFQLANDSEKESPIAAKLIRNNFYVDDGMFGADTVDELCEQYSSLKNVLSSGGFNLRKWSTNCAKLREIIPDKDMEIPINTIDSSVKTLGISWATTSDVLQVNVMIKSTKNVRTKRELLSQIASLYDPLGWLAPIILKAKMLMQSVWLMQIDWDDQVPSEVINEWIKIRTQLCEIGQFELPRWLCTITDTNTELHAFCDASQKGMAAVVYVRTTQNEKVSVLLLVSKYKVAPIKQLTIPRLELSAAHLLSKLVKKVLDSTDTRFSKICLYSDSRVTLDWINGNPNRWKTFVATKVIQINKNVTKENWHHVPTKVNPADCASRGLYPNELKIHNIWWNGPQFLHQNIVIVPCEMDGLNHDTATILKERVVEALVGEVSTNALPEAATYCELKKKMVTKKLGGENYTVHDLKQAEIEILKIIQGEMFGDEINCLKAGKNIQKSSKLIALGVFLDGNDILRVGGRLTNADMNYDSKHQILLPSRHEVSRLIIREAHEGCMHGGPRLTEAVLREKFWIINSQHNIKKVINNCTQCVIARGKTLTQQMADLPAVRVNKPKRPFINCMIDYAGPIKIKSSTLRAAKMVKAYIAIFVCMAVKAVHIEPVSDQTSAAFIAALRRFTARRGRPANIYSDNGTNFVGASREIVDMSNEEREEVNFELTNTNISFHFSPAGSPHFNGLVEAAVKSVKTHLKKAIGEVALTFEELATTLYQIESAINSRPLCAMSNDPNDKTTLTPAHFLIMDSMAAIPEEELIETNINWLTRWNLVQRIVQQFWHRWQQEYLHTLQQRNKWRNAQEEPSKNDLVLVKDENLPSTKWPVARIMEKHAGPDGKTRVVSIETESGSTLKRAITKIVRLPQSTEAKKIEVKKSSNKGVIPIVAAMCMVAMLFTNSVANAATETRYPETTDVTTNAYNVSAFSTPPVIIFKRVSTAYISSSEWDVFAYFNLARFFGEIQKMGNQIESMNETCSGKIQIASRCNQIVRRLQLDYNDILSKSDVFLTKPRKSKRAILNIVGNIASDLFGVLDSRFEEKYKDDMSSINQNEEHLQILLKKQTSVLETALNVVKKNEVEIARQHHFLNEVVRNISKTNDDSEYIQQFFMAALQMSDECNRLSLLVSQLLESVSNLDLKHINLNIISHTELKNQIELIHNNVEKSLMVPDKNLYSVMQMKPYLTKKNIIFKITIPLLLVNKFQIFQTFPTPFRFKNDYVIVNNISPYIITSLDFKRYELLGERALEQCQSFDENTRICHGLNRLKSDRVGGCEWDTLTYQNNSASCEFTTTKIDEQFVKFDDNKYIYTVVKPRVVTITCNQGILPIKLGGEGFLSLRDDCTLDSGNHILLPKRRRVNAIELHPWTNELIDNMDGMVQPKIIKTLPAFEETDFRPLENELSKIREENMVFSVHNVHHYTLIYGLIIVVIAAILYFKWKFGIAQPPTPAPRRAISMPTIFRAGEC